MQGWYMDGYCSWDRSGYGSREKPRKAREIKEESGKQVRNRRKQRKTAENSGITAENSRITAEFGVMSLKTPTPGALRLRYSQ